MNFDHDPEVTVDAVIPQSPPVRCRVDRKSDIEYGAIVAWKATRVDDLLELVPVVWTLRNQCAITYSGSMDHHITPEWDY